MAIYQVNWSCRNRIIWAVYAYVATRVPILFKNELFVVFLPATFLYIFNILLRLLDAVLSTWFPRVLDVTVPVREIFARWGLWETPEVCPPYVCTYVLHDIFPSSNLQRW